MNSEELKKQSQQIINEARTKTSQEEQAEADRITDKIPELIKEAIAKKLNAATVMLFPDEPMVRRLAPSFRHTTSKGLIRDRQIKLKVDPFNFNGLGLFPPCTIEYELTGVARIVYTRCEEAGLNPYVAQTEDRKKWGIGITWE